MKRICLIVWMLIAVLAIAFSAAGENAPWDCPDCGRTGNTGNFCGGCGHPAPKIDSALVIRGAGDIVTFGTYPQTKDGTDQTPIEWIVLAYDEANRKALLLSLYGLDAKPYGPSTNVTWETSTIRAWLNGEFLNKAFNAKEQSAILVTNVNNGSRQGYSKWKTDGGNNTQDRVFLLSYMEANRYLDVTQDDSSNKKSRVAATEYAITQKEVTTDSKQTADGRPAVWWWLRSPGYSQRSAAAVSSDGSLSRHSAYDGNGAVRPAFWLNLEP